MIYIKNKSGYFTVTKHGWGSKIVKAPAWDRKGKPASGSLYNNHLYNIHLLDCTAFLWLNKIIIWYMIKWIFETLLSTLKFTIIIIIPTLNVFILHFFQLIVNWVISYSFMEHMHIKNNTYTFQYHSQYHPETPIKVLRLVLESRDDTGRDMEKGYL